MYETYVCFSHTKLINEAVIWRNHGRREKNIFIMILLSSIYRYVTINNTKFLHAIQKENV